MVRGGNMEESHTGFFSCCSLLLGFPAQGPHDTLIPMVLKMITEVLFGNVTATAHGAWKASGRPNLVLYGGKLVDDKRKDKVKIILIIKLK